MSLFKKSCFAAKSVALVTVISLGLSACAKAPIPDGINDPGEAGNRKMHEINKKLDKAILKPASHAYGVVTKGPISRGVENFANNLSLPGMVLNDLLQFKLGAALQNTARFAMNSTFGLGGLIDVATQNKLTVRPTDFGETLYVWGFPEGRFVELPVFGANTERSAVGLAVDFLINPTNLLSKAQRNIGTTAKILKKAGDRDKYTGLVDSVLYGSEDSYAQSRLLYLQSRRKELRGALSESDLEDPYAE